MAGKASPGPADGWMKRRTAHGKEGYLPLLVPAVETLTTPAPAAVSLKLTFNDASLRLRRVLDLYSSPTPNWVKR